MSRPKRIPPRVEPEDGDEDDVVLEDDEEEEGPRWGDLDALAGEEWPDLGEDDTDGVWISFAGCDGITDRRRRAGKR